MNSIDDMLETLDERIGNNYFLNKVINNKDFKKYVEEIKKHTLERISNEIFFTYEKFRNKVENIIGSADLIELYCEIALKELLKENKIIKIKNKFVAKEMFTKMFLIIESFNSLEEKEKEYITSNILVDSI
jgi:hypothetical protein|nr:MAG TPA: hypothetical protein [Caudoviricetes sp.]